MSHLAHKSEVHFRPHDPFGVNSQRVTRCSGMPVVYHLRGLSGGRSCAEGKRKKHEQVEPVGGSKTGPVRI